MLDSIVFLQENACFGGKAFALPLALNFLAAERPNVYSSCCREGSLAPEERNVLPAQPNISLLQSLRVFLTQVL